MSVRLLVLPELAAAKNDRKDEPVDARLATTLRTQGRVRVRVALGRVRTAAQQKKGVRFTALLHHIYAIDTLRAAFHELKNVMRRRAPLRVQILPPLTTGVPAARLSPPPSERSRRLQPCCCANIS